MILMQPINRGDGTAECCTSGTSPSHTVGRPWRTSAVKSHPSKIDEGLGLTAPFTLGEGDVFEDREDKWVLIKDGDGGGARSITFGTCCIKYMRFRFLWDWDDSSGTGRMEVKKNGEVIWFIEPVKLNGDNTGKKGVGEYIQTATIDLTFPADEKPCGNLWEFGCNLTQDSEGDGWVTVEFMDVG